MRIFEQKINDDLFNRLSFLYDDIDIQWWLYRGSLARQSLGVNYYKDWLKHYNKFISIFEDICDKEQNVFYEQIKDLDNLKRSIISEKTKLQSILYKDPYIEFCDCIDKLSEYIDKLIDILRAESDEG